ncbi:MAG: AAA family ATPase [Desulfovibrio sp.]|jgi:hypothetical protein|nr:AAA family ATPase [Desulfovibrio sp.]
MADGYQRRPLNKALASIKNQRGTFCGVFVCYGARPAFKGPDKPMVLLADVRNTKGNIVAERMWLSRTKGFAAVDLQNGDMVQFDALVERNARLYLVYVPGLELPHYVPVDYVLNRPTNILKLEPGDTFPVAPSSARKKSARSAGPPPLPPLTEEQAAVVEHASREGSLTLVQGYAGTGKTYVLHAMASQRRVPTLVLAPTKEQSQYATEAFLDLPHVTVRTFHSLAYGHLRGRVQGRVAEFEPWLLNKVAQKFMPRADHADAWNLVGVCFRQWCRSAARTVKPFMDGFLRRWILEDPPYAVPLRVGDIVHRAGIDPERLCAAVEEVRRGVFEGGTALISEYPCPHDAYLKMFQMESPSLPQGVIFVDDAQDATECMWGIVLGQGDALRAVAGDVHQGLTFPCVLSDGGNVAKKAGGAFLRLTASFRCSDEVAQGAGRIAQLAGATAPFTGCGDASTKPEKVDVFLGRGEGAIFRDAAKVAESGGHTWFYGEKNLSEFWEVKEIFDLKSCNCSGVQPKMYGLTDTVNFEKVEQVLDMNLPAVFDCCAVVKEFGVKNFKKVKEIIQNSGYCEMSQAKLYRTITKQKKSSFDAVEIGPDFLSIKHVLEMAEKFPAGKSILLNLGELNWLYIAMTRATKYALVPKSHQVSKADVQKFRKAMEEGRIAFREFSGHYA